MNQITTVIFGVLVRSDAGAALHILWQNLQRSVAENVKAVLSYGRLQHSALILAFDQWQKSLPDDVQFSQLPGFFPPSLWQTHAQLYYTVRDQGLLERIYVQIFSAIPNRRNPLSDSEQVAEFSHWDEPARLRRVFTCVVRNRPQPALDGSLNDMPVITDYPVHNVKQDRPAQLSQWSHTFLFLPIAKILCPSERLPEPFADASTDSVVISTAGVCNSPALGNSRTVS